LTVENLLLLILALAGAIAAFDAQALYYLSPLISNDLHLDNSEIGLVSSIVLLTTAVSAFLVGRLSDQTGRRDRYLIAAFLIFALCSGLSGLASSFAALFFSRALMGVAEGPVIPLSLSIMMASSSPRRRGFNAGIVQNLGAQLVGSMLGPIIIVRLATLYDWRTSFYIAGVPGLLVAAMIALYVRDPIAGPTERLRTSAASPARFRDLLAYRNIRVCMCLSVLMASWYFLLLTFLPLYCLRALALTPERMSYLMGVSGAAGVTSSIVVPYVSDRMGRKPVLILFFLMSVMAPVAPLMSIQSNLVILLCIFCGSLGIGTTPLIFGVVPIETVANKDAAAASGLVLATGAVLGGFGITALAGGLSDRYGLSIPLYMAVGSASCAAAVGFWLVETAPRAQPAAHSHP
jgi:predicted MFS family arabinose efflux permease